MLCIFISGAMASAQRITSGQCGKNVIWTYDGSQTLTISRKAKVKNDLAYSMNDYSSEIQPPWIKEGLDIRIVRIEPKVDHIGDCAFKNCENLNEVIINSDDYMTIGWGAFMNCPRLRKIVFPTYLEKIGPIAFANCPKLREIAIPPNCRVEEKAFMGCTGLSSIDIKRNVTLGDKVFGSEVTIDGKSCHGLYSGEVIYTGLTITEGKAPIYGINPEGINGKSVIEEDPYEVISDVDAFDPKHKVPHPEMYALVIGNESYKKARKVPFAKHDACIFAQYCERVFGIPYNQTTLLTDATKYEMQRAIDDLKKIKNRDQARLLVYYAGHGVPYTYKDENGADKHEAYLLPLDVHANEAEDGISLNQLYADLADLGFDLTTVFLDACFSGASREGASVQDGDNRGADIIIIDEPELKGNLMVFSATQSDQFAQGSDRESHGLFTYHLLKKLCEKGIMTRYGDLYDAVRANVLHDSTTGPLKTEQEPSADASLRSGETDVHWENWYFWKEAKALLRQ